MNQVVHAGAELCVGQSKNNRCSRGLTVSLTLGTPSTLGLLDGPPVLSLLFPLPLGDDTFPSEWSMTLD